MGDLVKLIFEADAPSGQGRTAERMWVEVREVASYGYVGALENEPSFISDLKLGASISFRPEHVAALYTSPSGLSLPYGHSALVSREIVEDDAWPVDAERTIPEAAESSGWIVRSENARETDLIEISVDELIQKFRILDSILDEPVGTKWHWDEARIEYEAHSSTDAS